MGVDSAELMSGSEHSDEYIVRAKINFPLLFLILHVFPSSRLCLLSCWSCDHICCRTLILSLLRKAGLNDPTGQLVKEVDGWDIWNIDKDRANQLRRMSQEWLIR